MVYKQILGALAVFLALVSYFPYVRDIMKGETKPHAFSWLIWLILTAVGFFIQMENGAGPGAWFNGFMIFVCAFIMIAGIAKGRSEIIFVDWICLALASIATYFWLVAKDPYISITLVIAADALGTIPTIRKSYIHPHTETIETYAINAFRIFLAIFALEKISFITASYHVYMILANALLVSVLLVRRKK